MIKIILMSIFLALHGAVHLLYAGQSRRIFELRPGMTWPDGAWVFSSLPGNETVRWLAAVLLVIAALGFLTGAVALLFQQVWWEPVTVGAAVLSALIFFLFWDGSFRALAEQGGIGLLISLAALLDILF